MRVKNEKIFLFIEWTMSFVFVQILIYLSTNGPGLACWPSLTTKWPKPKRVIFKRQKYFFLKNRTFGKNDSSHPRFSDLSQKKMILAVELFLMKFSAQLIETACNFPRISHNRAFPRPLRLQQFRILISMGFSIKL